MNKPAIYTILDFTEAGGIYTYKCHYVAACSSEEAETIFKAQGYELHEAYIQTDAFRDYGDQNIILDVGSMKFDEVIDSTKHQQWVVIITLSHRDAGHTFGPTYRKIS